MTRTLGRGVGSRWAASSSAIQSVVDLDGAVPIDPVWTLPPSIPSMTDGQLWRSNPRLPIASPEGSSLCSPTESTARARIVKCRNKKQTADRRRSWCAHPAPRTFPRGSGLFSHPPGAPPSVGPKSEVRRSPDAERHRSPARSCTAVG